MSRADEGAIRELEPLHAAATAPRVRPGGTSHVELFFAPLTSSITPSRPSSLSVSL